MNTIPRTQDGDDSLARYFQEISRIPLLDAQQEQDLSRQVLGGDDGARKQLIQANLRLVVKIAKAYTRYGMAFMDLIQEGNLGLMHAAGKFDYHKNVRFSTYASWWIKQSIVRALVNKNRMIRLPHRKEECLRRLSSYLAEAASEHRNVSVDDLVVHLGLERRDVLLLLEISGSVASLDKDSGDDALSLLEQIEDRSYQPESAYLEDALKADTEKLLSILPEREHSVISHRFAFCGGKRSTLKTVGDALGLSAETVRQVEIRALQMLRSQKNALREYQYS